MDSKCFCQECFLVDSIHCEKETNLFDENNNVSNSAFTNLYLSSDAITRQLVEKVSLFRHNEAFFDVYFLVENSRIGASRDVLATSSDYFRSLLKGGFKESREFEIALRDVKVEIFEILIDFCYFGFIEKESIFETELKELLLAANRFQIRQLFDSLVQFLKSRIPKAKCFHWLEIAKLVESKTLKDAVFALIKDFEMSIMALEKDVEYLKIRKRENLVFFKTRKEMLYNKYNQISSLNSETLIDLLDRGALSVNQSLFFEFLVSNLGSNENSRLLNSLLETRTFAFHQMAPKALVDLLNLLSTVRNSKIESRFSVLTLLQLGERQILTALCGAVSALCRQPPLETSVFPKEIKSIFANDLRGGTLFDNLDEIPHSFGTELRNRHFIEIQFIGCRRVVSMEISGCELFLPNSFGNSCNLEILTSADYHNWETVYNKNFLRDLVEKETFLTHSVLKLENSKIVEFNVLGDIKFVRMHCVPSRFLPDDSGDCCKAAFKGLKFYQI